MEAMNNQKTESVIDLSDIAASIKKEMKYTDAAKKDQEKKQFPEDIADRYIQTGIEGFDKLLKYGIPKGLKVIIEGNAGSGKTIFALQILVHHARQGKKCLYISYEESEERLMQHMRDFGWNPDPLVENGTLTIKRYLTSDVYYEEDQQHNGVKAMMARDSDHVMLDLEPFIIGSEGLNPDITVIDSLTAIASTFLGKDRSYRFHLERLFRFLEKLGSTNFLITEPSVNVFDSMQTSCEQFLSDGIIVLYNARRGNIREHAIEILKMRGAQHEKKIVAMKITNEGIKVFPEQEVFGEVNS